MILFAFKVMHFGGGAEKNLIEVAEHVAQRHPVGFYVAGGDIDPRMLQIGRVFRMPGGGRFWLAPLDLVHLAWVVLRHRIGLMHAHHRYPAFMASVLRVLLPLRLITTVHNRFPNRARASLWGDRAIAVSEDIADWLRSECGTPAPLIRVVHNGIEEPAQYSLEECRALRAQQGVSDQSLVLCAVGRLSEQKNFALLLDALARIRVAEWTLLLVGEGEQRDELQERARSLGLVERVRFLGRRADVPLIFQASDLLVMSSAWEGFPYVVVEALASGLPIVATDVGGVREGVLDGGTGRLVKPGDADALRSAIESLAGDPELRRRMAQAGRELFQTRFRKSAMLRAIDEEIEQALRRGDPKANRVR